MPEGHVAIQDCHRWRWNLQVAYFLGPIGFDSTILIGAIAAIVGGVVVLGSNSSTAKQAIAAMKDAETQRAKLIDRIDFGRQMQGAGRL